MRWKLGKFLKFPEVVNNNTDLVDLLERSIDHVRKENAMKHVIDVESKAEGEAVKKALENPVTRAIVVVEGALSPLTLEQQRRVMAFVSESLSNETGQ